MTASTEKRQLSVGLEYLLASVMFFLMLFGPKTLVGNVDLLGAACGVSLVIWYRYLPSLVNSLGFWMTVFSAGYILVVLGVTGVLDWWWILKAPRMLLNFAGVFALVCWGLRRLGPDQVLRMFHNAVFVHALIVIGIALVPSFGAVVAAFAGGVTKSTFQISGLTRGLALTAIVMMFPFVTYPLFNMLHGYREKYIYLKLAVIFWATIYMGRTGFYLCLSAAVLVVAVLSLRTMRTIWFTIAVSLLLAVMLGSLISYGRDPGHSWLNYLPGFENLALPLTHMFEPLFRYLHEGVFTADSVEQIREMPIVFHNETVLQSIFGTGLYGRGDDATYLPTDVAYLQMYSAFGIVGVSLFVAAHLLPLVQYLRLWRQAAFWACAAITVIILIANFKETALFTRHLFTVQILFLAWLTQAGAHRKASSLAVTRPAPIPVNSPS